MTLAQRKKLDTIIGKIERLQLEVDDRSGEIAAAKVRLLRVLRDAGGV